MNPEFPIFIPTKGRHESRQTIKALEARNVPYRACVEPQEYDAYAAVVDPAKLLVLPHSNRGLTVTRNWIWDYARDVLNVPYFWTIDDNMREFYRLHRNIKYRTMSGTAWYVIEQFMQRYSNLYIAGMQYEMFAPRKLKWPPFVLNTRVYSNMLIKTDIPYRNRLFFNDDTDLCLQILKDGHCTCQFNAFLAEKEQTMALKGGMTEHYRATNNRLEFCRELQDAHPDVVKIAWKWNRWQHVVDYRPFKGNRLVRRPGVAVPAGVNNFGMGLTGRRH